MLPNNFKLLLYEEHLKKLNLPTLNYRRKCGDMIMMKKLFDAELGNTLDSQTSCNKFLTNTMNKTTSLLPEASPCGFLKAKQPSRQNPSKCKKVSG